MRVLALILAVCPSLATAQSLESMQRASDLASVLGSEQSCDLTLDKAGIEAWIAANVPKDDLSFAGQLQFSMTGVERRFAEMSTSGQIAYCAAIRQSASAMGLIK